MQQGRVLSIDGMSMPVRRLHVQPRPAMKVPARPLAVSPTHSSPKIDIAPQTATVEQQFTQPETFTTQFKQESSQTTKTEQVKVQKKTFWEQALSTTRIFVLIATTVALAFFSNFIYVSQLIIAVYAILALILRIKSQTSFKMALVSLACIVLLTVIKPGTELSENFAIFAFLFLVIGTIQMAMEVRRDSRETQETYANKKFQINS